MNSDVRKRIEQLDDLDKVCGNAPGLDKLAKAARDGFRKGYARKHGLDGGAR